MNARLTNSDFYPVSNRGWTKDFKKNINVVNSAAVWRMPLDRIKVERIVKMLLQ